MGRFCHQKPGISSAQFSLQLSIWVLIVSQHDQYINCPVLAPLSPSAIRFAIGPIIVEALSKPAKFAWKSPSFHSHLMNISPIANLNVGGERGANTAQCTYWSCHDTIRTHILNWSQSCRNRILGTAVRFQPGQIPAVLCPGRVTTRQDKSCSGFWPVLEPNQTEPQVITRTAGGLPGPIANTIKRRFCFVRVNQTYEPWHQTLSLPPGGPYLATSDIAPDNKVNTRYNSRCSEKELFSTSGSQIWQIDKEFHTSPSSC